MLVDREEVARRWSGRMVGDLALSSSAPPPPDEDDGVTTPPPLPLGTYLQMHAPSCSSPASFLQVVLHTPI